MGHGALGMGRLGTGGWQTARLKDDHISTYYFWFTCFSGFSFAA